MFIARTLRTIHELNLNRLHEIATHEAAVTISVEDDGIRHIQVDLTSFLADVEW